MNRVMQPAAASDHGSSGASQPRPVLFLARPIHHSAAPEHEASVRRLVLACLQVGVVIHEGVRVGESLITRARNMLVHDALKTNCTHILFIDTDIAFEPKLVFELLARNRDVIGCAYPKKCHDFDAVIRATRELDPEPRVHAASFVLTLLPEDRGMGQMRVENGCVRVQETGTGFLLVKREVFLKLAIAQPSTMYLSDHVQEMGEPMFAWFDTAIRERRYLSEDYEFCRRWRALGGDIWIYADASLTHIGNEGYTGNLAKSLFEPRIPFGFELGECARDHRKREDLIAILHGSYDLPIENVTSVLDVGAHVGAFAHWAHTRWPSAKITCYEPDNRCWWMLKKNAGGFATLVNKAVGGCVGSVTLRYHALGLGNSSLYADIAGEPVGSEQVEQLSAAAITSADVVKIDTEGAEVDILRALQLTSTQGVAVEYHRPADKEWIESFLLAAGFKLHAHDQHDAERGVLRMLRACHEEKESCALA